MKPKRQRGSRRPGLVVGKAENRWEGHEHTCCAGGGTSSPAQIQLPEGRRISQRTGHISAQLGHTLWVLGPRCPTPIPLCGSAGFGLTGHMRALFGLEVGEVSNTLLSPPRWFSQVAKT